MIVLQQWNDLTIRSQLKRILTDINPNTKK